MTPVEIDLGLGDTRPACSLATLQLRENSASVPNSAYFVWFFFKAMLTVPAFPPDLPARILHIDNRIFRNFFVAVRPSPSSFEA